MATGLQNMSLDKLKTLALVHSSKLIGVAVGCSSVLFLSAAWSLLTSRSDVIGPGMACVKIPARGQGDDLVMGGRIGAVGGGLGGGGGGLGGGDGGSGGGVGGGGGVGSAPCTGDGCPWQYVISDLTNRLHLLEAAFKEQVLAREMMAQEVNNQSDSNEVIEKKLMTFIRRIEELERMVRRVESRMAELSARLNSDEFIGFVVIVAIMVEVLLRVRPRVAHIKPLGSDLMARYRRWSQVTDVTITTSSPTSTMIVTPTIGDRVDAGGGGGGGRGGGGGGGGGSGRGGSPGDAGRAAGGDHHGGRTSGGGGGGGDGGQENHHANGSAPQVLKSAHANGVSFSPKHGLFLKPEMCVVAFRRDHTALSDFIDHTLRHLDDVRISVRPYYVIESHEHLRQCPRAKLYLVVFEMEERVSSSPQDSDLITSTVRYIKSLKANLILIVTNDEGSKKLTVHALYNTHLRLLQSHEAFQDLTSAGRVFSAWRELTSHQTSHMRKIVKTVLNIKPSLR